LLSAADGWLVLVGSYAAADDCFVLTGCCWVLLCL